MASSRLVPPPSVDEAIRHLGGDNPGEGPETLYAPAPPLAEPVARAANPLFIHADTPAEAAPIDTPVPAAASVPLRPIQSVQSGLAALGIQTVAVPPPNAPESSGTAVGDATAPNPAIPVPVPVPGGPVVPTYAPTPEPSPRDVLRAASEKAVQRLVQVLVPEPSASNAMAAGHPLAQTAPGPFTTVSPAPATYPGPGGVPRPVYAQRPSIAELTRQVEAAVTGAAAAETYQREVEQKAREVAADVIAEATQQAQRALDDATEEREGLLVAARVEADRIISEARAQAAGHEAEAEARAQAVLAHAELELGRRILRIAELTDGITDIAETVSGRLAAGSLSGGQLAQFITALTTVTERALAHLEPTSLRGPEAGDPARYPR